MGYVQIVPVGEDLHIHGVVQDPYTHVYAQRDDLYMYVYTCSTVVYICAYRQYKIKYMYVFVAQVWLRLVGSSK